MSQLLNKDGEPIQQPQRPNWPIRFDATPDAVLRGSAIPEGTPTHGFGFSYSAAKSRHTPPPCKPAPRNVIRDCDGCGDVVGYGMGGK